jgi:hypothetical protein
MKKLVVFIAVFVSSISFTQVIHVPGTHYPYYSDIIKFQDSKEFNGLEILPVDKNVNLQTKPIILNQDLIQKNMIKSINAFRKQYGKKSLKLNDQISKNLSNSIRNQQPIDRITWSTIGFFNDFNYVRNFENKELKFCDLFLDLMSIDSDLFFELINSNATEFGFYYRQDRQDTSYDFAIYIR